MNRIIIMMRKMNADKTRTLIKLMLVIVCVNIISIFPSIEVEAEGKKYYDQVAYPLAMEEDGSEAIYFEQLDSQTAAFKNRASTDPVFYVGFILEVTSKHEIEYVVEDNINGGTAVHINAKPGETVSFRIKEFLDPQLNMNYTLCGDPRPDYEKCYYYTQIDHAIYSRDLNEYKSSLMTESDTFTMEAPSAGDRYAQVVTVEAYGVFKITERYTDGSWERSNEYNEEIWSEPINIFIWSENDSNKDIVVDSDARSSPQEEDGIIGGDGEDKNKNNNSDDDNDEYDWQYQDGGEIDSGIVNGWKSVKDALGVLGGLAAGIAGLAMGLGGIGSAAGGATGVEQQNPAESPGNTAVEPKKAESLKKVQKMLGTDSTDPKELMELYKQRQIDEIKSGTEEGIWGDYMEQFEKYFEKVSDSADKASTVIAAFTGEVGSDMANNLGALKAGLVRMEEDLVNDKGFFTSIKNGIVEGGVTYAQNNVNGLLTRILAYGFGEGIKANTNGESFSKAVGNGLVGSYVDSTIDNIYGELGSQIKNGTMNYRDREAFGDATDFIVSQMGEDAKGKVGELVKQRLENAANYVGNTLTYGMIRTVEAAHKSTRYVAGLFRSIFKS